MPRLLWFFACLAAVGVLRSPAAPWPPDDSDLPADPSVIRGTLGNGVRFSVMHNATPPRRISVRLLVAAGSEEETESEMGVAHFIEHMVFRGTRSHPHGSLLRVLEQKGMTLGPEVSAFTFFDHTIYSLELEDADSLEFGLGVLREFASEVTFEPDLLENERGVVLSEMDTRNTPDLRLVHANMGFLWPRSRYVGRMPIGTKSSVQALTRADLVKFYNTWYRPERLAVVIAGDVNAAAAEALVRRLFGALTARAPARPEPADAIASVVSKDPGYVFQDPGLRGVMVKFENPIADPHGPDTHDQRIARIRESMVAAIIQRRMVDAAPVTERAYAAPMVSIVRPHAGWKLAEINVSGTDGNWKRTASELGKVYAQLSAYGFTMSELEWIKTSYLASFDEAVRTARTRPSYWLADRIAQGIVDGERIVTPETLASDVRLGIMGTSPDDALEAFRGAWGPASKLFVAANSYEIVTLEDAQSAISRGMASTVRPLLEPMTADFAYESFGTAGRLARSRRIEALDITLAEFENGSRLNFKHTDYEADMVTAVVRVGRGKLTQPLNKPGIDLFAWAALLNSGLNGNTPREIQLITTGHDLGLQFNVDTDSFTFSLRCPRADFPLGLKLIAAYLTDAAFDPGAMLDASAQVGTVYSSIANTPGMAVMAEADRVLSRGDRRFGVPAERDIAATSLLDVGLWVAHQFKHGPLQLSVAGDITLQEVVDAAACTLGALPRREEQALSGREGEISFVEPNRGAPYTVPINPVLIRESTLGWFWPVADLEGIHQERRCRLLARILEERIRIRLREELGATYSPSVDFVQHEGFKAFNYFVVLAPVMPGKAEQSKRLVDEEIHSLLEAGIPEDLFSRAKIDFLRQREDDLLTNSYWAYTVLRSPQSKPETLAAALDRSSDGESITRAQIEAVARRYLALGNERLIIAEPGGKPAQGALR